MRRRFLLPAAPSPRSVTISGFARSHDSVKTIVALFDGFALCRPGARCAAVNSSVAYSAAPAAAAASCGACCISLVAHHRNVQRKPQRREVTHAYEGAQYARRHPSGIRIALPVHDEAPATDDKVRARKLLQSGAAALGVNELVAW